MRTGSGKHTLVVGEVLECSPPHRFVHTHRFTQYDDPLCQVSYDLKEVPGGVQVTLRVAGVTAGSKTAKDMASGGTMIVNALKAICETGKPGVATRLIGGRGSDSFNVAGDVTEDIITRQLEGVSGTVNHRQ